MLCWFCPCCVVDAVAVHSLRSFRAPADPHVEEAPAQMTEDGEKTYHPPEITILYSVSARVEPLFREANKRCVSGC